MEKEESSTSPNDITAEDILTLAGTKAPKRDYSIFDESDDADIFQDSEDRERLMSLPESKREAILYERHNRLKELNEKREVSKRLQMLEKSKGYTVLTDSSDSIEIVEEKINPKELCSFKDMEASIVTRDMLAKNMFKPFFKKMVIGTFVRVRVRNDYFIGRIVDVGTSERRYSIKVGKSNGNSNIFLDLNIGTRVLKGLTLEYVSNSKIDETEFEKIPNSLLLTSDEIISSYEALKREFTRPLTDLEMTETIQARRKIIPSQQSKTMKKVELITERELALDVRDYEKANEIQKKIEDLEKDEPVKEESVWDRINARNRKINYEIGKKADLLASNPDDENDAYNPFKRKRTKHC
ncbi:RNA polymerase-associated protein RTF1 like protein [Astathelohania contejeani]|uniref:RNA polymerase-associated protein RTF1 like protein n=1 Tax=Astathelohania contejeani TaxID=164912 RepID=A0ABQ7HXG6_9MICR|nr:RNA polymerase-associated protein RTF1 like protein [Thelohania contejeani]